MQSRLGKYAILVILVAALLVGIAFFWRADGSNTSVEEPSPAAEIASVDPPDPVDERKAERTTPETSIDSDDSPADSATTQPTEPTTDEPVANPSAVSASDGEFDRYTMLANILNNVVLPANENFMDQAAILRDALRTLEDAPTIETVAAAQEAWRATSNAWAQCDLFSSRELALLHNQIDKWPSNIEFIEGFIAEAETLDQAFIASIGSTAKGLPAIEYLLFAPDSEPQEVVNQLTNADDGDRRRAFLVGLGDHLYQIATELSDYWLVDQGDGTGLGMAQQFLESDPDSVDTQAMLSLIMNGISEQLEDNLQRRLWGVVQNQVGMQIEVESPYAHHSIAKLQHGVSAFLRTFHGGAENDMLGLDDYLTYLDVKYAADIMSAHVQTPMPSEVGTPLAELIIERTNTLLQYLDTIEEPLPEAILNQTELLEATNAEALRLLLPVRVDMNNKFGVTISFNDGD